MDCNCYYKSWSLFVTSSNVFDLRGQHSSPSRRLRVYLTSLTDLLILQAPPEFICIYALSGLEPCVVTSAPAVPSLPLSLSCHVRCRRHATFSAAVTSRSLPPSRHVRCRRHVTFSAAVTSRSLSPSRHVLCRRHVTFAAAVTSRTLPPSRHVRCRRHVTFAAADTSRSLPPSRHIRCRRHVTYATAVTSHSLPPTRHVRCRRHVRCCRLVTFAAAVTSRSLPPTRHVRCRRHVTFAAAITSRPLPPSRLLRVTLFRPSPLSLLLRWVSCQLCELTLCAVMYLLYAVMCYMYIVSYFINGIPIWSTIIIHDSCCVYAPPYIDVFMFHPTLMCLCSTLHWCVYVPPYIDVFMFHPTLMCLCSTLHWCTWAFDTSQSLCSPPPTLEPKLVT